MDSPLTTIAAVLCALTQGEGHGAELAQRLRTRSGGAIDLPDGSLYPALQGLIKAGAVYEVRTEARRRIVALTPQGHVVAQRVLECLVRVTSRDGEA